MIFCGKSEFLFTFADEHLLDVLFTQIKILFQNENKNQLSKLLMRDPNLTSTMQPGRGLY